MILLFTWIFGDLIIVLGRDIASKRGKKSDTIANTCCCCAHSAVCDTEHVTSILQVRLFYWEYIPQYVGSYYVVGCVWRAF